MDKVKWGVLGTANIAAGQTIPGLQGSSYCELYAIAGRNLEKAESFKERFGFAKAYGSYEELLEDEEVCAVYIPLPNTLHKEWTIKALNAGKHVLCEKPLALNARDCEEMYKAAEDNGVYLMEAYAYLHSPYFRSVKDDISRGLVGDIKYIETAFVTQGYKEDIRIHKSSAGGAMYDLGCYCTTMILSLTDKDPVFVDANVEFGYDDVDVMTSVILKFEDGMRASFTVGMILGEENFARYDNLSIVGSRGVLRSRVEYNQEGTSEYDIITGDETVTRRVEVPRNYTLEADDLSLCILKGNKPYISPEFSIRNARLMDQILAKIGYWE